MNFLKITLLSAMMLWSSQQFAQTYNEMTEKDQLSYSLGVLLGNNLKSQGFEDLNPAVLAQAVQEIMEGKAQVTPQQANQMVTTIMQKQQSAKYKGNIEEGEAFLAANAKKDGVVTLPSGLQYQVMKEGTGPKPKATDKVVCHYHGTLLNGDVFDSSVQRGQPATFPVGGVIKGWVEALQLMNVGSKWKLFVPQNLAYGERGAGGKIKPYMTLVFEVELLSIAK